MNTSRESAEALRLEALQRYDILDSPSEETFDRITRLVKRVFDLPIATIAFLDAHRQWFKSRQGLAYSQSERGIAICDAVVKHGRPLVVRDLLEDTRFSKNPLVTGEPHLRFYASYPVRTPDRQVIGTLCAMDLKPRRFGPELLQTMGDLAAIVTDELELRRLVSVDRLTGAMSRRSFLDAADRLLALASRHQQPLTCISVDFDLFARINDVHGHSVGDAVLAASIATFRSHLRQSDLIGRIGDDAFAIVLPQTGLSQAMKVAEKLRSALAWQTLPRNGDIIPLTASFGLASYGGQICDIAAMLECADCAVRSAKQSGGNRWAAWEANETGLVEARRRVLKAGKVIFNGGRSAIDCTVRNLSTRSAGLDVSSAEGIPQRFKLAIAADNFSRLCRIAVTRANHIEVEFA